MTGVSGARSRGAAGAAARARPNVEQSEGECSDIPLSHGSEERVIPSLYLPLHGVIKVTCTTSRRACVDTWKYRKYGHGYQTAYLTDRRIFLEHLLSLGRGVSEATSHGKCISNRRPRVCADRTACVHCDRHGAVRPETK